MRRFLLVAVIVMAGCNLRPSLPEGITPVSEMPAWGYPDTVRVYVWGAAEETGVRWDQPATSERMWLHEHGYVHAFIRSDSLASSALQEVSNDALGGEPLSTVEGQEVVAGHRYYVQAE